MCAYLSIGRHPVRQFFSQKLPSTEPSRSSVNGDRSPKLDKTVTSQPQRASVHHSRLDAFQSVVQPNRTFSSLQAYQNHVASLQQRDDRSGGRGYPIGLCSPMPQRKFGGGGPPASLPVRHVCVYLVTVYFALWSNKLFYTISLLVGTGLIFALSLLSVGKSQFERNTMEIAFRVASPLANQFASRRTGKY